MSNKESFYDISLPSIPLVYIKTDFEKDLENMLLKLGLPLDKPCCGLNNEYYTITRKIPTLTKDGLNLRVEYERCLFHLESIEGFVNKSMTLEPRFEGVLLFTHKDKNEDCFHYRFHEDFSDIGIYSNDFSAFFHDIVPHYDGPLIEEEPALEGKEVIDELFKVLKEFILNPV